MNRIDTQITKQFKDIIQKQASEISRDDALEFYGIKSAKIKELVNIEFPKVEVSKSSSDLIFLLEDNTYLHLEFQTKYKLDDLIRFSEYNMRIYRREKKKVKTVIIYSSDVKKVKTLDTGSVVFTPLNIMMYDYDGDKIFKELDIKIQKKQKLTGIDIMNIALVPLMKNTIPKIELAKRSIEMANTIEDKNQRDLCIASAVAFAERYLSETEMNKLEGVIKMVDIVAKIVKDDRIEIAKKLLKRGIAIKDIAEDTGLDIEIIEELQEELEEDK